MIKPRDQSILNFITDFSVATSGQIFRLFFKPDNYRYCMQRLKYLSSEGFIKTCRSTISNEYAYYIKKPSLLQQTHHDLIRSELYTHLRQKYNILHWENEYTFEHIRPDAICYIDDHGIVFPVFIEIHLNNKFNFDKYKELLKSADLKTIFGIMPRVLICTDRKVTPPAMPIKFKIVDLEMKGLDNLFK